MQPTPLKDQAGSLQSTQPTDQPRVQTLRPTVQRLLALTRHKRRARQADRWPELARTPTGLCYAAFHGVSWRRQAVDRLFGVRKSSSQQTGQLRQRLHSGSLCPSRTTLRCWIRQSIRPSTQLSAASNRYSHPAALPTVHARPLLPPGVKSPSSPYSVSISTTHSMQRVAYYDLPGKRSTNIALPSQ